MFYPKERFEKFSGTVKRKKGSYSEHGVLYKRTKQEKGRVAFFMG